MQYRIIENEYASGEQGWIVQSREHTNGEWKTHSRVHQNLSKAEDWIQTKLDIILANTVVDSTILPTIYE